MGDRLLRNATAMFTMNDDREILRDAAVLIGVGQIAKVGTGLIARDAEVVDEQRRPRMDLSRCLALI